mgnify:CR=1 FL=1
MASDSTNVRRARAAGSKCLCNALLAAAGHGQVRPGGEVEPLSLGPADAGRHHVHEIVEAHRLVGAEFVGPPRGRGALEGRRHAGRQVLRAQGEHRVGAVPGDREDRPLPEEPRDAGEVPVAEQRVDEAGLAAPRGRGVVGPRALL